MAAASVEYVQAQINNHTRLFFTQAAASLLRTDAIRFSTIDEAVATRGRQIVIPVDIPIPPSPAESWLVPFNGTALTLWNRVSQPGGEQWRAIPNEVAPVWYQHTSGTLIPAWNLFGNVFDLLTFGEEQRVKHRDGHGRFASSSSPRYERKLLDVPAVNEAVALLVAAVVALSRHDESFFTLDCLSGPPVVVLSHDCDVLLGNDFWSQSARLFRILQPMTKIRLPQVSNLWWFVRNAISPRRFYFDNVTGMRDIETCFGYTSTMYMLNGSGGRFGARNKFTIIPKLFEQIPSLWDIGVHYNYDTFLDDEKFSSQLKQLQDVAPDKIVSGRAHYLKFDPSRSFSFLQQFGIQVDESSGWSDCVGYRNGIAGCFRPYDAVRRMAHDIWELPMVVMEDALIRQHGDHAVNVVERHLQHLGCIGGALTILVHPGQFNNPEHSEMLGVYHDMLKVCRRVGAVSYTARRLVERL